MRRQSAFTPVELPVVSRCKGNAFTLVELLVVVAILAVLLGLLVPAMAHARSEGRRIVCMSNLQQLALATHMYLDDSKGAFWRYYRNVPGGRHWWFGYEDGGPGSGTDRPLDKEQGLLADYIQSTDDGLQCPTFPYHNALFYPKFAERSASYGYNLNLGPVPTSLPTAQRSAYLGSAATVVVFADAVHFDFGPTFNEGHYLDYTPNAATPSGYAHFRHNDQAQMIMLDGHSRQQRLDGPSFRQVARAESGNLTAEDGSSDIYGK